MKRLFSLIGNINFLAEPRIRELWVLIRAVFYVKILKRVKTLKSEDAFEVTVKHNYRALFTVNNRMDLLIKPVSAIEVLNKDSKFLIIGPRNENDIYSLAAQGFRKKNIIGYDLISYSSSIKLGDMHAIDFPESHFDSVICGWTLSYSASPQKAANEMIRVVKNKGVIAIGVEYSTLTEEDEKQITGYFIQETSKLKDRINSTEQIKKLFSNHMGKVYFDHDAPNKISHRVDQVTKKVSNVALIFEVKK
jgi:SAM-dependent methyltransferase